jgi:hypothetical protein
MRRRCGHRLLPQVLNDAVASPVGEPVEAVTNWNLPGEEVAEVHHPVARPIDKDESRHLMIVPARPRVVRDAIRRASGLRGHREAICASLELRLAANGLVAGSIRPWIREPVTLAHDVATGCPVPGGEHDRHRCRGVASGCNARYTERQLSLGFVVASTVRV